MTTSSIDQTFARANIYKLLSFGFSAPAREEYEPLLRCLEGARISARLLSPGLSQCTDAIVSALTARSCEDLAAEYASIFTFSTSPDCPLNESAYAAKHIYHEVQALADISGFYSAFGLDIRGERPDELAAELEFCAYLAFKEAYAREQRLRQQAQICRDAYASFLREHLGRWAENIGRRVAVLAPATVYAAFGDLLTRFAAEEIARIGGVPIAYYQEVPNPPQPLDDEGCPAEAGFPAFKLNPEDVIGEIAAVDARRT